MKRILIAGALLLLPGIATAGPWTGTQLAIDPQTTLRLHHNFDYGFNCSTGGAGSLLVGAVAAGLLVRRRK